MPPDVVTVVDDGKHVTVTPTNWLANEHYISGPAALGYYIVVCIIVSVASYATPSTSNDGTMPIVPIIMFGVIFGLGYAKSQDARQTLIERRPAIIDKATLQLKDAFAADRTQVSVTKVQLYIRWNVPESYIQIRLAFGLSNRYEYVLIDSTGYVTIPEHDELSWRSAKAFVGATPISRDWKLYNGFVEGMNWAAVEVVKAGIEAAKILGVPSPVDDPKITNYRRII